MHGGDIMGGGVHNRGIRTRSLRSGQPAQSMVFMVETSLNPNTAGSFEINYVVNLRRLVLSLSSFTITDLAGNVPDRVMDIRPVIQNNRTLVPLRFIAEALNASVTWTDETAYAPLTVYLTLDGQTLVIPIGMVTAELAALGMDVPAQIMDSRTLVPLRFIAEFFGAVVAWEGDIGGIEIIWAPKEEE